MPFYKDRHDNTCSVIYKYIRNQKEYETYFDKNQNDIFEFEIPENIRNLRPDIFMLNRMKRKIIIMEVAYIYYNSNIVGLIENKENFKLTKYSELILYYNKQGYSVEFFPLLFDSTGFIVEETKENIILIFKELHIKKPYMSLFKTIISNTLWNTSRLLNNVRKYKNISMN